MIGETIKFKLAGQNLVVTYIRWVLVGLTTLAIDFFIFRTIFNATSVVILANACSMSVSGTFNYLSHKNWTFPGRRQGIVLHKYIAVMFIIFILNTTAIHIFIALSLSGPVSKLISIVLLAPLSFILLRKFVFSH